ncbi:MAG TPA: MarR family transcriptional regulator [Anaerolineaceae bacterium]|nr:MarR family transcriptional regulator [Anaerolineaceae bacterium]
MTKPTKIDLIIRTNIAARGYGIQMTMFRNVIFEKLDVNGTDMECLGFLFYKRIATPTELARYTGLTSGATTAMLDRLEKGGFIERRPNPDDRRGTLIVLVKSGAEKVAKWFAPVGKAQEELISNYSEEELQLISDFFERYAKIWEQECQKLQKS